MVGLMLEAGAQTDEEDRNGLTPIQIAAKQGYFDILEEFAENKSNQSVNLRYVSNATGLNALHVAALYGEVDALRVLLTHMPAQMKANEPQNINLALSKVSQPNK